MTDARSEDTPLAPRRTLSGPNDATATSTRNAGPGQQTPHQPSGPTKGKGSSVDQPTELTERINAAYASSGPVLPDDTDGRGGKPTGAERFAAALATARGEKPQPPPAPNQGKGQPAGAPRKVRKARLRLSHIDPWSVMKTSFLLSVALGIVMVVAVAVIWSVLGASGIWDSIDATVGDVVGTSTNSSTFRIEDYLGMSRVMGFTMIVAVVDVVLFTVIATLGAFLYNLAAVLLGGLELTLAEDERPTTPQR